MPALAEPIATISEPVVHVRIKSRELYGSDPKRGSAFERQFKELFEYKHDNKPIAGIMVPAHLDYHNTTICIVQASRLEEFKKWLTQATWEN